jgi:hypothetical protein
MDRARGEAHVTPVTQVENVAMITTVEEISANREANAIYGCYRLTGCDQKVHLALRRAWGLIAVRSLCALSAIG